MGMGWGWSVWNPKYGNHYKVEKRLFKAFQFFVSEWQRNIKFVSFLLCSQMVYKMPVLCFDPTLSIKSTEDLVYMYTSNRLDCSGRQYKSLTVKTATLGFVTDIWSGLSLFHLLHPSLLSTFYLEPSHLSSLFSSF